MTTKTTTAKVELAGHGAQRHAVGAFCPHTHAGNRRLYGGARAIYFECAGCLGVVSRADVLAQQAAQVVTTVE
jgi:hypothetical protein